MVIICIPSVDTHTLPPLTAENEKPFPHTPNHTGTGTLKLPNF